MWHLAPFGGECCQPPVPLCACGSWRVVGRGYVPYREEKYASCACAYTDVANVAPSDGGLPCSVESHLGCSKVHSLIARFAYRAGSVDFHWVPPVIHSPG